MVDGVQTVSVNAVQGFGTELSNFQSEVNAVTAGQVSGQGSFSDVLLDGGKQLVEAVGKAEQAAIAGMKGEAGAYEVASNVMEAEQHLRMMTAIRDRMVQAFLEVSRMQI
ncbi:MAG: flagellar hook-basal body complex protein FliE [Pseudomonadota bacterium]